MIDSSSIQEVRDKMDIVEIGLKLVSGLKKSGASYKAKSPFANEKSASFFINESKQIFKCFSSGKGGDAIKLVMEVEKLDFIDAIRWIAEFQKIELRETSTAEAPEVTQERKDKFNRAHKLLLATLGKWTTHAKDSKVFAEWCAARKITRDDVIQWGIAQAPDEFQFITPLVVNSDNRELALELGIINEKNSKAYDTYRNRIIFPIHGKKGSLIGFGGRIISSDKEQPKFLNSKESFLYDKSDVLYGWHFAEKSIRQTGRALVVEGYVDTIALHRVSLTNVVGTCGTALSEKHARILSRSASEVVILMDGDSAGIKGAKRAIELLLPLGVEVKVCTIPDGRDPDDIVRALMPEANDSGDYSISEDILKAISDQVQKEINQHTKSAFEWLWLQQGMHATAPKTRAEFLKETGRLLSLIPDEVIREEYTKATAPFIGETVRNLSKIVDKEINVALSKDLAKKQVKKQMGADEDFGIEQGESLPDWAMPHAKILKRQLFLQKENHEPRWPIGIYFPPVKGNAPVFMGLERATNFCMKPLYQIKDERNGRWLVKLRTNEGESYLEIPDGALVEQNTFLKVLVPRRCHPYPVFAKFHYTYLVASLMQDSQECFELNTLGHQPEDFFAYSNAVMYVEDGGIQLREYDTLGVVKIKNKNYMSPGVSAARIGGREENNVYENDLYLKYVNTQISFSEWAEIFNRVYDDHGMFGIAFVFLSIYKDMIYRIGAKCPLLYLYGPKGSGKSAMGESIMFLFFSGKNAEGRLIQAVNMSSGMITDFALASALQRFRNCPRLFNEYDPAMTEIKYRGWFKAAFDGEGRERGSGDSGSKRKTEVMKVQGTIMIAGQYMDSGDDGAVMTRSINLQFSEEKNKNRSQQQKDDYMRLHELESNGLAGCLKELISIRGYVWEHLNSRFLEVKKKMTIDAKSKRGASVEARLLENYALCYSFSEIVNEKIQLPYTMRELYDDCIRRMVELSALISDGSVINRFWEVIEFCVDSGQLAADKEFDVQHRMEVTIRTSAGNIEKKFPVRKRLLFIRLSPMYAAYCKEVRLRSQKPYDETTIETYLKDTPYYIGSCPRHYFTSKETSAYVFDLEMMEGYGIRLFAQSKPTLEKDTTQLSLSEDESDDLPF